MPHASEGGGFRAQAIVLVVVEADFERVSPIIGLALNADDPRGGTFAERLFDEQIPIQNLRGSRLEWRHAVGHLLGLWARDLPLQELKPLYRVVSAGDGSERRCAGNRLAHGDVNPLGDVAGIEITLLAQARVHVGDVLGWCLLWFAFSSWMFHEVGLDAQQAQNYVTPLGLALLLGVRILALGSLMGQVGLLGSFQPWPRQPWLLLPLPRTTIQRALLRHIGIVALVAIGLNIAFLSAWAGATEALMWSPQHVQLRGLISSMVQSMAILTAIMAMAFMVVGTGLRGIIQLTCVAAGAVLSVLVYVDNIPVPGAAASYVPTAVANSVAVAVLMAAVWAVSWHRAGKPA